MQKKQISWNPSINKKSKPLYKEIVEVLRKDIAAGLLRPHMRLPAQRELAWQLGVNPSTIAKAYELATKEKLISGEVGRGTYICETSSEAWLFRLSHDKNHGDLTIITPKMTQNLESRHLMPLFSASAWGYIEMHEINAMQKAIRHWDNINLADDNLVLTAGANHALAILVEQLCGENDVILCEEYSFPGLLSLHNIHPWRLIAVKMDEKGLCPQALEAAIIRYRPRLLFMMSHNHNPTMVDMPSHRRKIIGDIIEKYSLTTIEDDIWAAFRPKGKSFYEETPRHIIRLSGFSKSIAGGLRIGWMRGYHPLLKRMEKSPEQASWMIAPPLLRLMLYWLETNYASELFEMQKHVIEQRYHKACIFLGLKPQKACAYLWLKTKKQGQYVASALKKENIMVAPAQIFSPIGQDAAFIRLSLLRSEQLDDLEYLLKKIKPYLEPITIKPST